ncbi:MAG: hypothetical protein E5V62_03885 [Mesorhizobium sp.]|uniref:hypothetical protein n=1 Tax=Mesorhizobium sp. TaxID=1871066 RepID=UPI000FD57777|nr:hypothetical protein [Mesorhizobium sp.]RVD67268.1 hypothetical protein EN751_37700 [Mesorhizobium sp. M4A.F.Ca.ET.029.04.2.1]TIW37032.1 MAG: hypothetical protein E5V62_03885 [Mesorhizobium sp.]
MTQSKKAPPFVPTEFHVTTVADEQGALGILCIQTTGGQLDVALDREAAEALIQAASRLQAKLGENDSQSV